jgi:hypothetical protein
MKLSQSACHTALIRQRLSMRIGNMASNARMNKKGNQINKRERRKQREFDAMLQKIDCIYC